jgi:S-formylglutathione hydrolase FrmB
VLSATVSKSGEDKIELTLTQVIPPCAWPSDTDTVKWIKLRSKLLSDFYGRDVYHLAGVALPPEYNNPSAARREWPVVYVIPGYGGRFDDRHGGAADYAHTLATPGVPDGAPNAVYVVLDPESPLGHHGFVDSPNNGPRGTALVTELIPHLEKEFRLVAKPEARLLTGHSSGAWTSLWLQLNHAEVFGGCWASAPDPVDFSAFQLTDLYSDASVYESSTGEATGSFRRPKNTQGEMMVLMTVRQEAQMEHALDPTGGSGQQWAAWDAMFSPRDEATGMPQPMFDGVTGAIDKSIFNNWSHFDIAKLVTGNWNKYGPVMIDKVHLACGEWDSFYLNRAVERFKQKVDALRDDAPGSGYIILVPRATHETLLGVVGTRFNTEMREHLIKNGLQEP